MGFSCGIIGLPNVGKSSLFNAISGAHAASSNYPFCTIEPNKATLEVPDPLLDRLSGVVKSERVVPTVLELVDVAGLVEGAHKGEGLGNQFLSQVRELDALAQVVRLFRDPDVAREGPLDPVKDVRIVGDELRFKDLETVEKRLQKEKKQAKASKDTKGVGVLEGLKKKLESEEVVSPESFSEKELSMARELCLLSSKPYFAVANIDEEDTAAPRKDGSFKALEDHLSPCGIPLLPISAHIEEEIRNLEPEEQTAFMEEYNLTATGLEGIIATGYKLLDLVTFYTFNEKELHAWTLKRGEDIVSAAGKVHTDMARGFIRADVVGCEDFLACGSFQEARSRGKVITAGRDHIVKDREIILVKFKV